MLERCFALLTSNTSSDPLPDGSPVFITQIAALRTALGRISDATMEQASGKSMHLTKVRERLRYELRKYHLIPISTISRVLESSVPGLPKLVNVPKLRSSETELLVAASAICKDIEPYKDLFISMGMPVDFVDRLRAVTQELERVGGSYTMASIDKTSARVALATAIKDARNIHRCLDVMVTLHCADNAYDPEQGSNFLYAWKSASHVQRINQSVAELTPVREVAHEPEINEVNEVAEVTDAPNITLVAPPQAKPVVNHTLKLATNPVSIPDEPLKISRHMVYHPLKPHILERNRITDYLDQKDVNVH